MNIRSTPIFLSLSQRERIKVRDCFRVALQARSKLPLTPHPDFLGQNDCEISAREFLHARGNDRVVDHVLVWRSRCGRRRQARRLVAFPDNKNLKCNRRRDVVGGICTRQSADYGGGAREFVRRVWSFYGGNERDSLGGEVDCEAKSAESASNFQPRSLPPHLNPLPRCGGEVDASARAEFRRPYRVLFGAQP